MDKSKIIAQVTEFLTQHGIILSRDYIWSLQGPTLIHIGENNIFSHLKPNEVKRILGLGAHFLIQP